MNPAVVDTYTAQIYIGGDLDTARRVCREWVYHVGQCVTVEPVEYIYKGGSEAGVRVGFINYPRFPAMPDKIWQHAQDLADQLITELAQHSYSIVCTDRTMFFSRREA